MTSNRRKTAFLDTIPTASIDESSDKLASKCKFNFAYFTHGDNAGQNFDEWSFDKLQKLLNKLQHFSKETLNHWTRTPIGSGKKRSSTLVVYKRFPTNSSFVHPKHVPHQAQWARFRLEHDCRLVGFILPEEYTDKPQTSTQHKFCCNTFYVVFLDQAHKFYITKK